MTLKITYQDGRVETHIGVAQITQKTNSKGENTGILVDTFTRLFALAQSPRLAEDSGVKKMELLFNTLN